MVKLEKDVRNFDVESLRVPTTRKLNDNNHHVARVSFTTDFIDVEVPNLKLAARANVTERFINRDSAEKQPDDFDVPKKFLVGTVENNMRIRVSLPTSYTGCMSGVKLVLHPRATRAIPFPKSIEIDLFQLLDSNQDGNNFLSGSFPQKGQCGSVLPTPGMCK